MVAVGEDGARALGERYWAEVERFARRVVRVVRIPGRVEVRLFARGPRLLVLGDAELSVADGAVVCRHAIVGGLLVRRAGGWFSLSQLHVGDDVELRSAIDGLSPSLWVGRGSASLYGQVQSRIHVLISRRFFLALLEEHGR